MATHALPSLPIRDGVTSGDHVPRHVETQTPMLRRLYDAILQSHMRRAQRDIERVLGTRAITGIQPLEQR